MQKTKRPSFAQLLDWKEGKLAREEERAVSQAISDAGDDVRRDLAWLLLFDQVQGLAHLTSAPARTLKKIYETYESRADLDLTPPRMTCKVGRLSYDSAMTSAMAAVRTGVSARGRQLVYSTDTADLALSFKPVESDQTYVVQGQVLQLQETDVPGYLISLEGDAPRREVAADRFGEFAFEGVESGRYRLFVSYDHHSIVVPEVRVTV